MPAEPVVLKRIPIAEVGKWSASTGEWEATRAKFDSAVRASQDRTLRQARVFLGHNEQRIKTGMDTVPAVGLAPRLVHENDVLYADHLVPPGIAAMAKLHWPSRSIEALEGITAPSGETYEMYVTGVAWLGDDLPAVDTLPDLAQLWGLDEDQFAVAASSAERPRLIVCALGEGAAPASAGTTNPRQEAPMPTPAPAEEPKAPAPDPKAEQPKGTQDEPKTDPKAEGQPKEPAKAEPAADTPKPITLDDLPDHLVVMDKAKVAEYDEGMKQLGKLLADAADKEAEAFADELEAEGVIAASAKEQYAQDYRDNPDVTRRICSRMPKGVHQPAPVGRVAATRANDTDGDEGGSGFSTRLLTPEQIADAKARGLIKED